MKDKGVKDRYLLEAINVKSGFDCSEGAFLVYSTKECCSLALRNSRLDSVTTITAAYQRMKICSISVGVPSYCHGLFVCYLDFVHISQLIFA